ncbi:TonB-dependent receptor [Parashewanella spongiae]|nr:TonB-dependent receptor [Parashewanella spongiae]MCL1079216.1 TonB-dependent receptor [Parashewanella spongiae]
MKHSLLARYVKLALFTAIASTSLTAFADDQIERIIVKGQKIDRELQETPTSVAVITESQIEDEQLINLYEVLDQIPNVSGQFGRDFSIRGINSFNVSGGGTSYLTSVYVDGAILPYRMIQQGAFNVWDVNQVEVLRGPQSTLQGRNALAGAIWITTEQPTYDWSGKTRITVGENGQREAAVAVGGELVDNQVAFRFSGENNNFDGVNKNITRNDYSDYNENQTYRLKFLFEPNAIEGLSATLSYTYNDSEIGVPFVAPESTSDNRFNIFNDETYEFTDNDILTLTVAYDISDDWSFDAISTYLNSDYGYRWDGDQGLESKSQLIDDRNDKTKSQEIRFTYEGDKLNAVFGAYYSNIKVKDVFDGPRQLSLDEDLGVPALLTGQLVRGFGLTEEVATLVTNQLVMPIYSQTGFDPAAVRAYGNSGEEITSAALYSELSYQLNDNFEVFGGLRYDYEKQSRHSETITTIENVDQLPDPTNPLYPSLHPVFGQYLPGILATLNSQIIQFAAEATGKENPVDESFSELLPKLGASYFINDSMSTHITYQRGYRSGGVGRNIANNEIYEYDAEFTNNYEISLRSAWLNDDLVVNANLFYLDWKDQQVSVQGDALDPRTGQRSTSRFNYKTVNAGSSNVKGFELESFYALNNNLKINFGFGFSESEFTDFIDIVNQDDRSKDKIYTGQSFARAPKWTTNFGATYTADNGFFMNVNANYQDSSADKLVAMNENAATRSSARTIVNTRVGYNWDNFGLFLTAKNLLDNDYYAFRTEGGTRTTSSVEYGAERQVSLSFEAKF